MNYLNRLSDKERAELSFWKHIAEKGLRGFSKSDFRSAAIKFKQYGLINIGRDIGDIKDKIVIEVCCGPTGIIVNSGVKKAIGIDPLINVYSKLWDLSKDNVEYVVCEIEKYKPDISVDIVICWNGVDHLTDLKKTMEVIRKLLKEDGEFWTYTNLEDRGFNIKYSKNLNPNSPHRFRFNEVSLDHFFYSEGFHWKTKYKFTPLIGKTYTTVGIGGVLVKGKRKKIFLLRSLIRALVWRVAETKLMRQLLPEG